MDLFLFFFQITILNIFSTVGMPLFSSDMQPYPHPYIFRMNRDVVHDDETAEEELLDLLTSHRSET